MKLDNFNIQQNAILSCDVIIKVILFKAITKTRVIQACHTCEPRFKFL